MYDELVKRLREHGEFLIVSDRIKAPPNVNVRNVFAEDYYQAADAIEELSKPRWIPVTAAEPEDGEDVLCWISDKRRSGQGYEMVGCYNSTLKLWDMDADWVSTLDITHWRTLPEPPKEEA